MPGEGFAMGVAAADYDNDGFSDLFIAGVNRNLLYRNRGNGTFEDVTDRAGLSHTGPQDSSRGRSPRAGSITMPTVCWTCSSSITATGCRKKNRPAGSAKSAPTVIPAITRVCRISSTAITVTAHSPRFPNRPASPLTSARAWDWRFLDYDLDGRLDVFVANDTVPNFLFHNQGGGQVPRSRLDRGRRVQ